MGHKSIAFPYVLGTLLKRLRSNDFRLTYKEKNFRVLFWIDPKSLSITIKGINFFRTCENQNRTEPQKVSFAMPKTLGNDKLDQFTGK